jgi:spore maturation protein B
MKTINYISTIAIPAIIIIIIAYAIKDKKKMYDIFIEGAKEGMKIVVSLFPTLLGIFIAVGTLRSSGILEIITNMLSFLTNKVGIPSQVIPLALLRPISGSASLAVATDIMTTYGVDSKIRINYINNDGVNRNHILCYCNIYKQFEDKKDKICVSCSVNC